MKLTICLWASKRSVYVSHTFKPGSEASRIGEGLKVKLLSQRDQHATPSRNLVYFCMFISSGGGFFEPQEHGLKSRYQYWYWAVVYNINTENIDCMSNISPNIGRYYIASDTSESDMVLPIYYYNRPIFETILKKENFLPHLHLMMHCISS